MSSLTISLELPRDLLGALNVSEKQLGTRIKEMVALELFREGYISSGRGAELLGIPKLAFIGLLARHDVPYFTQSPEELTDEVRTLEHLLKAERDGDSELNYLSRDP